MPRMHVIIPFTHLSGMIGGTFLSVSCRNNTNKRKNMGFSLVCVEKKKSTLRICLMSRNSFNIYYHFQREGAHRVTVQHCLNTVGQHGS